MTSPDPTENSRSASTAKPVEKPSEKQAEQQITQQENSSSSSTSAAEKTVQQTRQAGDRSSQRGSGSTPKYDVGSIGLLVLVVLAVIASLVMLISGSAAALKIALIAALWAAVIGFFLVVRYRREAQETETKLELQERAHRAEMSAAGVQAGPGTAKGESAPSAADMEALKEIREELAAIRSQIEDLTGREFTYEPAALRAEARRIMELEAQNRAEEEQVDFTQSSSGAPSSAAISGLLGSQNAATSPRQDNPLNDIISEKLRQQNGDAADAPSAKVKEDTPSTGSAKGAKGKAGSEDPTQKFDTGSFQAVRWNTGGDETAKIDVVKDSHPHATKHQAEESPRGAAASAKTESKPAAKAAPEAKAKVEGEAKKDGIGKHEQPSDGKVGRRRSDERREGSVSVAELLAQMKKGK